MLKHDKLFQSKIKYKLILIFAVIILYTMVVISFFGYGSYRKLMIDKSLSYNQRNTEELSEILKEKIDNLNSFTRTVLYDNRIYNFNKDIILAEPDIFFQYQFGTDVENYLRGILFSKDEFISVGFKFKNNVKTHVTSRIYTLNTDVISDIKNIYAEGLKGKGSPMWYVSNINGINRIYITKIVYDMNSRKEIGVFIFRINPDSIFKGLKNISETAQQNMYIYDNAGHQLFNYTYFEPKLKDFSSKLKILKSSNEFQKLKTDNDTLYANCTLITPENFKLIMCVSSNSILKEVNKLSAFLFFLFLLTIPIIVILVNYFQKDIIKPLNLLVSKMEKIENGEIGTTIDAVRADEIGYAYKTFNTMSQEIKVLIDSVYREQIALKDEENKALQAQINPHFLYNTLEAINWKARIHKVPDISEMVTALSYIMEANMNRNNEKLISIEKEIEYINNYKFIIEKRFNDKLRFKINAPEETLGCQIPKLIILPIIENAVYHGLEMKKGDGLIMLDIDIQDKVLCIKVEDNGLGMDEEILLKIKNDLDIDINDTVDRYKRPYTSIGLINVHKRMKLLYGNEYGLEISSLTGNGTFVLIKLPVITD
jgi:two-component system, sensor histidine kinase YesM